MLLIPADIIYAIIDEIRTDTHTLKQCSLVSRSFLSYSHRHLFAAIQLDHPTQCRGLYRVLMQNPSLVSYIRRLVIVANVKPEFRGRDWVTIENTLSTVILMLHNLHAFTLRNTFERPIAWDVLPIDFRSAILDLSTTGIHTITLHNLANLPIANFSRFLRLKQLQLLDIHMDHDHSINVNAWLASLLRPKTQPRRITTEKQGHLESLDIQGSKVSGRQLVDALMHPKSLLGLTKLQDLTLYGNCSFAKDIMCVAAPELEHIVWKGLGREKEGMTPTNAYITVHN